MREAPSFGGKLNSEVIEGLATVDEKMLILLSVAELVCLDIGSDSKALEGAA